MRKTMMMTAAGALLAATAAHAQWTDQLLNDYAVTNEFGQMIVLHDGGGYYNSANSTDCAPEEAFNMATTNTYYDASINNGNAGGWAGFELQSPKLITRIRYTGRANWGGRTTGTLIQGANTPDFSDAVTLWTLPAPPNGWNPQNTWLTETFTTTNALTPFTFVRFYATQNNACGGNFTRVEFYGADPMPSGGGAPETPTFAFEGCINGRMNLIWPSSADTILYEIQRKIAHEDDFSPLNMGYAVAGSLHFLDASLLLYQDTDYRIRGINCDGESAWTTVTGLARNNATGQWIGSPGTYANGMTGDKAFDGNVTTYFDGPSSSGGSDLWTGLDFGSEKEITGIRFVPRRDSNHAERMDNGWFEVADNPDFINPTGLYTNSGTPSISGVTEIVLAQPVTARYARYCSPNEPLGWGNIAEAEFVLAPAPSPPNGLSIASVDVLSTHATLSWSIRTAGGLISSTRVHRATSPGGPYDCMTPDGIIATDMTWTDTTVLPRTRYYYKVSSLLNTTPVPLETLSGYMTYVPHEWIERNPGPPPQTIKPGMTLIGTQYPIYQNQYYLGVQAMFDGILNSYVDILDINPAIGVDLGKPHCIRFMRFAARNNSLPRLNGAELRGSNDPDYTNNFTRLATFANSVAEELVTIPTVTQEPFRYIFIQRPDGNQFYGNINELELYGWAPDDANGGFQAPLSVTLSIQPGGVRLDWAAGTEQDSYRIERSTDGENWASVGTTPAPPFTDTTPLIAQRALYRIVAVRMSPPGEGYSDPYPIIAYAHGGGTGLTANYFTSFVPAYNTAETYAGTFTEPAPDFSIAVGATPIRAEVPGSGENIRIVWTGKLIVPLTGDYTFYVTCDDGFALRIDDTFVLNRWYYTSATEQVTVHLTAGEHPLRLDYFQGGGIKGMKLEWGGSVERAVIPASQLLPDPLPTGEGVFMQTGDWSGRTFGGNRLGFHTLNPDGSITIRHVDSEVNGAVERFHAVVADKLTHRDFVFEAKVDLDPDPLRTDAKAMLMVRNDLPVGSPFLAVSTIGTNANGNFNVKQRLAQGNNITDAFPTWTGPHINPVYLQIKRVGNVFTFSYRDPSDPPALWMPFHTFEDEEGVFNTDLYASLVVCAPIATSPKMFQTATFSEISHRRLGIGTLMMLK